MMWAGGSIDASESVGVGIRWSEIINAGICMVCIESIIENSPAALCQRLKPGDILVLVDNTSVHGQRIREVKKHGLQCINQHSLAAGVKQEGSSSRGTK
jgi:C-terminal processing protease CtpA/Prc